MKRRARTQVRDLMTSSVVALRETDLLVRARELMEEAVIRHVPVIDDRRRVIGLVSNEVLAHALACGADESGPIELCMQRAVRTVRPETPAREAARMLLSCHVGALPVIDDDERLIGILSRADFLGVAHDALDGDLDPLAEAG